MTLWKKAASARPAKPPASIYSYDSSADTWTTGYSYTKYFTAGVAGNLLLMQGGFYGQVSSATVTAPAGWTLLSFGYGLNSSSYRSSGLWYKWSTGGETSAYFSWTGNNGGYFRLIQIQDATNISATSTVGYGISDSPSHTASFTPSLWVATTVNRGGVTGIPSGYTNPYFSTGSAQDLNTHFAWKAGTGSNTENPPAWSSGSNGWSAHTVGIE